MSQHLKAEPGTCPGELGLCSWLHPPLPPLSSAQSKYRKNCWWRKTAEIEVKCVQKENPQDIHKGTEKFPARSGWTKGPKLVSIQNCSVDCLTWVCVQSSKQNPTPLGRTGNNWCLLGWLSHRGSNNHRVFPREVESAGISPFLSGTECVKSPLVTTAVDSSEQWQICSIPCRRDKLIPQSQEQLPNCQFCLKF